jgi:hypothetical protein
MNKTPAKATITKTKATTTKKTTKKSIVIPKTTRNVPVFFPKYPEYRLADIIATVEWRTDNLGAHERLKKYTAHKEETLEDYIHRLFPTSIGSQYLRKTKLINDIDVLSDIVNDFVTLHNSQIPADDVMVMHLLVGDVIDQTDVPVKRFLNRPVNSWYEMFGVYELQTCNWNPVYVRCLESFDRALKKTTELGLHKICLVYGFHIKEWVPKSRQYIAALVRYARSEGFKVEIMTHADADVSFAYACKAKHFVPGGGGFSKLMSKVVSHHGNNVYEISL